MNTSSTNLPGTCLHLLFSPATDTVQACLQHAQAGDSLVLLNTAVTLLLDTKWLQDLPANIQVYVVDADMQAQGMDGLQTGTGTQRIDDAAWAGLVISHLHCLSWK